MGDQKILSILIPAYNYKFGVFRLLQTFERLPKFINQIEIIILDDSDQNILGKCDINISKIKS